MQDAKELKEKAFRDIWGARTVKQIEGEIKSWQRYMEKNLQSYVWHGKSSTPPDELPDGDKVRILREILQCKREGLNV